MWLMRITLLIGICGQLNSFSKSPEHENRIYKHFIRVSEDQQDPLPSPLPTEEDEVAARSQK